MTDYRNGADFTAKLDEYLNASDFASAGEYLAGALTYARENKDEGFELTVLSEVMGFERQYGSVGRALEASLSALEIIEKGAYGKCRLSGMTMLNSASVYLAAGRPADALELLEKAGECFMRSVPQGGEPYTGLYNNTGAAYAMLGSVSKAEYYYGRALSLLVKNGDSLNAAVACVNLCALCCGSGRRDEGLSYARRASVFLEEGREKDPGYYRYVRKKVGDGFAENGINVNEL